MKKLLLGNGESALVDDEQFEWLSKYRWQNDGRYVSGEVWKNNFHDKPKNKGKKVYLHRVLLWCPKGFQVDHINGDGLDNRLENLRIVTPSQNSMNNHTIRSKSGYKGVYPGRDEKWCAQIQKDNKCYCLGTFSTKKEAALAYNIKAKELFGEHAYLNKI